MILCACMYALNIVGLSLALFGQFVMVHLARFMSMCAHLDFFLQFVYLGPTFWTWSIRRATSSIFAVVVHILVEVLKW